VSIKFRFVCATRETREGFYTNTALGRSLRLFEAPWVELRLSDQNRLGLPRIYNQAIRDAKEDPAILVFIHDDVHLCDFFWPYHVLNGLESFDVIGLAGNRRRVPGQPSWAFVDKELNWDAPEHLSGVVAHGKGFPPEDVTSYGPPRAEVKLLDGVFLAARSETLLNKSLEFDERFDFHFYDLDFCRQAEMRQLRMGTWMIALIHESGGSFGSPAWRSGYQKYLEKWGS
jgi:GT2 family glycosyltransferase